MVWVLGTVFAILFGLLGYVVDVMMASDADIENENINPYISFWASAAGTVVGCATATLLAGRPLQKTITSSPRPTEETLSA
jgi:hypothetical protein